MKKVMITHLGLIFILMNACVIQAEKVEQYLSYDAVHDAPIIQLAQAKKRKWERRERAQTLDSGSLVIENQDESEVHSNFAKKKEPKKVQRRNKEKILESTTFSFSIQEKTRNFYDYSVQPGDVLDVLYQVKTWEKTNTFKIAVGHTISIKFIHAPELNETQQIRPDGKITLAYLGEISVVGKTVSELMTELKLKYKNILADPELYITIPDFTYSINELKKDLHTSSRGSGRLIKVRPDGHATFPLMGDLFVANKTIPEIAKQVNSLYSQMLPGLYVDVFLESYAGSSVSILGMVHKPGSYQINKPITVLEALSLAGGYMPGAKLSSVFVLRKHQNQLIAKRINVSKALSFRKGGEFIYLYPSDMVYVPKNFIKKAAELAKDLQAITFFRGVGFSLSYELNNTNESRSVTTQRTEEVLFSDDVTGASQTVITETSSVQ